MKNRFSPLIAIAFIAQAALHAADADDKTSGVLFSESFDDSNLLKRKWYDGDKFTISENVPVAGKGCIDYSWKADSTKPDNSSGVRHLFEPSETVFLRVYIMLSKGWGWSGRGYHPHLMHFMTTENPQYAGPAASHRRTSRNRTFNLG